MTRSEPLFPLLALSRLRMETDGPGVTTLVAGAGCPLRCKYCINRRLLAEQKPVPVTPETLFARTRIDDLYFQATGGGLCFGGGEPLLHADFIAAFRALTGGVWKLTAETSLAVSEQAVRTAAACVDRFIVDVKTLDPAIYRAYTGGESAPVLRNLSLLLSLTGPERLIIRLPLIPGFNTESDRRASLETLKGMGFTRFDLFTYETDRGASAARSKS